MNSVILRIVWVPLWYPKNLCCKLWNESLKILYLTCNYEVFARFYYTLKSDAFAWFQSTDLLLFSLFFEIRQKHQTSKCSKILQTLYNYMWDIEFWGSDFKVCNTNFVGTTMVPILYLKSLNSFQFLNKNYIDEAYKCDFTVKRGTPNGTQNNFSQNIHSELFSNVSSMGIVILHQKLHTAQCLWFFDIPLNS